MKRIAFGAALILLSTQIFASSIEKGLPENTPSGQPVIWLVPEHHEFRFYREAVAEIVRGRPVDCVFFEDSPEMDKVATDFVQGKSTFLNGYLQNFIAISHAWGLSAPQSVAIWNENFSGREDILAAAKARGARVFHVDYTSQQAPAVSWNPSQDYVKWNFVTRHEIMARNISAHRQECPFSVFLVGYEHQDPVRELQRQKTADKSLSYNGPVLSPIANYLRAEGFSVKSMFVMEERDQDEKFRFAAVQGLNPELLASAGQWELYGLNPYNGGNHGSAQGIGPDVNESLFQYILYFRP